MPQGPFQVLNKSASTPPTTPSSTTNVAAAGNTQVKTGAGTFNGLTINTGVASTSITLYDGTSAAGKKLGTWATTAQGQVTPPAPASFTVGLFAVVAGGSPDVTIYFN